MSDRSGLGEVEWFEFPWKDAGFAALARPKRLRDWIRLLWRGWRFHTVMSGELFLMKRNAAIDKNADMPTTEPLDTD